MFGVVSRNFVAARHPFRKWMLGCIQSTNFCHQINFFVFLNEHAQSTTLGPKLMFGEVSRNFVAARHPFRKRVSRCIQSTSFCPRNCFFVFHNEHAQSTTLGPQLMFGVVSRNFVAARHPFRKRVSGCIESTSFCHRINFFVLCSEHAQSTNLGPKLMFGVVSRNFVAACHPFRIRVSRCIQSTSFCHRINFIVFHNEHSQSTTLGPKLMFGVVSRNFVAARHPFRKRVSGVHTSTSFCHRINFFVFRNEHAQSTTLGPKHMFGVVSRNFVATCHPFRKRVSGCIQSTSFGHRINFFVFCNGHAQSTTLGPKHMFGVILRNFVAARHPFRKRVSGCIRSMSFCHRNHFFVFLQRTCPIHYFRSKTHVWCGFVQFRCRMSPIRKRVSRCIQSTSFCHRNHFFVFCNEHVQSTNLGPKLMFGVVSRNFVATRHPFRKMDVGFHSKHEFLPPEPFLCFSQRKCPIHYFWSETHVWCGFTQFLIELECPIFR
jgi:hypothetical protein